jgi:hypothetical protein
MPLSWPEHSFYKVSTFAIKEAPSLKNLMVHVHVHSPLSGHGMALFIRVFDLEAAERNADSQRDRLTETGSSKTPYLFSTPIIDRQQTR